MRFQKKEFVKELLFFVVISVIVEIVQDFCNCGRIWENISEYFRIISMIWKCTKWTWRWTMPIFA